MEYVNRFRTSTDDDLGHMLENCLVVFEDSVERLKWEEVTSPCEDCRRNRMTSELLSRTSASMPSKGSKSNYVCLSGKYSVLNALPVMHINRVFPGFSGELEFTTEKPDREVFNCSACFMRWSDFFKQGSCEIREFCATLPNMVRATNVNIVEEIWNLKR